MLDLDLMCGSAGLELKPAQPLNTITVGILICGAHSYSLCPLQGGLGSRSMERMGSGYDRMGGGMAMSRGFGGYGGGAMSDRAKGGCQIFVRNVCFLNKYCINVHYDVMCTHPFLSTLKHLTHV